MKQIKYITAGFAAVLAAVLAAGVAVAQAPDAAALAVHNAPGKCVKAEENGGYIWKCNGGSVTVRNNTKVFVGVSVSEPPPPVLSPLPPKPAQALVEYTVQVFYAGVHQIPENSLFTKMGMASPGLTTADEIQSALGVSDASILQALSMSGITFQKTVSKNTVTLVIPPARLELSYSVLSK